VVNFIIFALYKIFKRLEKMGKGDLRTKKGKMKNKSFGKLRSKRALSAKNRIHTKVAAAVAA
jgi:ribosomal small subunit protein bTHX